jgi:hypothetical protein
MSLLTVETTSRHSFWKTSRHGGCEQSHKERSQKCERSHKEPPSSNICLATEIRCVPVHYSRFNIKTTPPTQPPGQHTSFSLAPSHIGFRIAAHRQINLAPSPCSALWLAAAADDQSPRSPDAAMPVSFPPGLE